MLLCAVVLPLSHLRQILEILSGAADPAAFDVDTALVRTLILVVTCQLIFLFNDLYRWRIIRSKHQSSIRLLESSSYTLILTALLYFALDGIDRYVLAPRGEGPRLGLYKIGTIPAVVAIVVAHVAAYGFRRIFDWTLFRIPIADRVLMIGDAPIAAVIEHELHERRDPTYEIVGYVLPEWTGDAGEKDGKTVLCGYGRIVETVKEHEIHRVVVCLPERRGNLPVLELLNCKLQGVKVEEGELMYERVTGKIAVDRLRPSYLIFSEGFNRSKFTYLFKRGLDVVLALVGIVIAAPLALLTALAVKLDSRGPVLFSQPRVGKDGRIFTLYKFRSMRTDAEKDTGPVWAASDDDRVTRVGRVIRKIRLDEIPQLINVLRNEMSFVGPRPERPFFVEELKREIPFYTERLVVKPGVTGWAQINYRYGASKEDALQKLQFDLYYIKNMSIFLDVLILFRTIRVVLLGFGAR
ncbi:MAG: TIGR03013 family PEP-CTERM/XrtA system glycosyltransferase [Planctomycetes bacterium]|nr:TIGR03013 family PEP-CTERM/XrtA system glycosyltransferase [Planctomycetota bacterium]